MMFKYANQANFKKNDKSKNADRDKSLVPEALMLSALGLTGYSAVRHKSLRKALEPVVEGSKAGVGKSFKKVLKKNKGVKAIYDLGAAVVRRAAPDFDDLASLEIQYKKKNKIPFDQKLSKDQNLELKAVLAKQKTEMKEFVDTQYREWAKKRGVFETFDDIPPHQRKDFENHLNNAYSSKKDKAKSEFSGKYYPEWATQNNVSDPVDKIPDDLKKQFDRYLNGKYEETGDTGGAFFKDPKSATKKDFMPKPATDEILKGIGFGAGAGAASLGVHALGQKYFENSDDDKVRALIRKSYATDPVTMIKTKIDEAPMPAERAEEQLKFNERQNRVFNKIAANLGLIVDKLEDAGIDIDDVEKAREAFGGPAPGIDLSRKFQPDYLGVNAEKAHRAEKAKKIENKKDMHNQMAGAVIDSLALASLPFSVSKLMGRDIRSGFAKLDQGDAGENEDIIIDVPIQKAAMNTRLAEEIYEESKGLGEKAKDFAASDRVQNFIRFRKNYLAKILPWVAAPSAVAAATGLNFNLQDQANASPETPIPEGHARVVIKRKAPQTQSNTDDMMMKSAKMKDMTTDEVLEALRASIEKTYDTEEKPLKVPNMKEGLIGRQYQFKKHD